MNNSDYTEENACEKTLSYKSLIKGLNKAKNGALAKVSKISRTSSHSGFFLNKSSVKPKKHKTLEIDSVGEEGTAQVIRSPIVKRGKSNQSSLDITNSNNCIEADHSFEFLHKRLESCKIENLSLKQEIILLKSQLKTLSNTILSIQQKLEYTSINRDELEEKVIQLMQENKKMASENEKLTSTISMFDNEKVLHSSFYLRDDLEHKILSLDREKDEKQEQCLHVLISYLSCLNEFFASEQ